MIRVLLTGNAGAAVIVAVIPPFLALPEVLTWGARVFVNSHNAAEAERWGCKEMYREAFNVHVVQTEDCDLERTVRAV